jgi:hypothetical protein
MGSSQPHLGKADSQATVFKVRIENISRGNVLKLMSGGDDPFYLSEDG